MSVHEKQPEITALAPWFGAKRSMASEIVQQLGKHTQYFEPFCGSMAVLLSKPKSRQETVNDLHGDLINLARVVQGAESAERLYAALNRTLFAEELLFEARDVLANQHERDEIDESRAYWFFVQSWMERNGVSGTERKHGAGSAIAVRYTANGGSPTVRFRSAADSLPAWHYRLQNVIILRRDALKIIPKFEDAESVAIYVDPPYVGESRTGYKKSGGAQSRYVHEFSHGGNDLFAPGDDHEALAKILREFQSARVVVSYYDCPRVRELYRDWTFIDKTRNKALHNQGARGKREAEAPEVLIVNGPEY